MAITNGNIYVIDGIAIKKYNTSGVQDNNFSSPILTTPRCITGNGSNIFVTDGNDIKVFDYSFNLLLTIRGLQLSKYNNTSVRDNLIHVLDDNIKKYTISYVSNSYTARMPARYTLTDNTLDSATPGLTSYNLSTLPIDKIGPNTFKDFVLSSVTFPSGLKEIGESAFQRCNLLDSLEFPTNLEKIGNNAFRGTILESVEIPATVRTIGDNAFAQCQLTSVIIL
jgi:hypothetical protein